MRIIKRSTRENPKLSLILLDWGVRESFHLLHYLKDQTLPRDVFEVILIEFYDTISEPLRKSEPEVDTLILLDMPANCYYHKHLMYNAGIVFSQGEILMFGDSDAMVRPTFVETILTAFERDPQIVYHMDEFRNVRRDLYPFNFPSFEDVLGDGCINNAGNKTKGILDEIDPMHTRNYGACMCAWRKDIISIGGADEDPSYLGHVCGPYEMTFRLMNSGRRLVWETDEYLYHTWHPGSDGVDNYLGPHDGKNMSTTAFQALCSGRIPPHVESEAIRRLRTGAQIGHAQSELLDSLIDPRYVLAFNRNMLGAPVKRPVAPTLGKRPLYASYRGFDVYRLAGSFYAAQPHLDPETIAWNEDERVIRGASFNEIRDTIDAWDARLIENVGPCSICALGKRFAVAPHELGYLDFRLPSHRENPRVIWVESLGEARKIANLISAQAQAGAEPDPDPALARLDLSSDLTRVAQHMADLEHRVTAAERDVSEIYKSRTWRAITRAGGVLQRILRLRTNHPN